MANAVDHSSRQHGNPSHLNGPHGRPDHAEKHDIDDEQKRHAKRTVPGVEIVFNPVVRRSMAVSRHQLFVLGGFTIKFGTSPEHGLNASGLGAVGIILGFALRMVFTVNGCPFFRDHSRGHPKPKT